MPPTGIQPNASLPAREAAQIAHKLGLADVAKFDQLVTQLEKKVAK
jgi:hypothetical protein